MGLRTMSSKEAYSLEKDESILYTFESKIELKRGDEERAGCFILTNQNIIFLDEQKSNVLFKTPLENIVKVVKSLRSKQFIAISLRNYSIIQFSPLNINYDEFGKLCALLPKTIREKKQEAITKNNF